MRFPSYGDLNDMGLSASLRPCDSAPSAGSVVFFGLSREMSGMHLLAGFAEPFGGLGGFRVARQARPSAS